MNSSNFRNNEQFKEEVNCAPITSSKHGAYAHSFIVFYFNCLVKYIIFTYKRHTRK